MESDEEIRRQFEEIIAGLAPGELRDVGEIIASIAGTGRALADPRPSQPSQRRPPRPAPATFTVKVTLIDSQPAIWRRLEVRSDALLIHVHQAIQSVFGWWDYHLHRFAIGDDPFSPNAERFDCPEEAAIEDAGIPLTTEVRLDETLSELGDRLHYIYDFGDNWNLVIELEAITEAIPDVVARCIAGERAAPPEDCGGLRTESELREVLEDPAAFDLEETNTALMDPLAGLADWGVKPEVLAFAAMFRGTPDADAMLAAVLRAPRTTIEERTEHLAPITGYLEHVGEGVPLTAAGYLKPADLDAIALVVPTVQGWIHSRTREVDCDVALDFRLALQRFGLLRKAKGVLSCTKAGARARKDPEFLWRHLASRLLMADDDAFTTQARIAYLLATASGHPDPEARAASWLAQLGWAFRSNRAPVESWMVHRSNPDVSEVLLHLSTTPVSSWRQTAPSAAASDLARAALLTED